MRVSARGDGRVLTVAAPAATAAKGRDGQNRRVDLARAGWLMMVLMCVIAVLILVLQGYYGYAGVTFAVALAAAINLV